MKQLNSYITEKLKINKESGAHHYNYCPDSYSELRTLVRQLIRDRGEDADLNDIDISKVDNISNLFAYLEGVVVGKIKIDKWDVSHVIEMRSVFEDCDFFDADLSSWDVSNVEDMQEMFLGCTSFKGKGLENWNVHHVEYMDRMFKECENFNADLSNWDVSNLEDMSDMFYGCSKLRKKPDWYHE